MNKTLRSRRRASKFHKGKSRLKQLISYYYKTPFLQIEITEDRIKGVVNSPTPIPDISFDDIHKQLPKIVFS